MELKVNSYSPLPGQQRFHNSNAWCRFYMGGFGAGKTKCGVQEALDVSMTYPKNFGVIARKTYRELEDSTKKTFFDECPPELIREYRAKDDAVTLINGSVILFRSLDDPKKKFGSMNLGWAYIDEASEIEDEEIALYIRGRLRLSNVPWRGIWFTSNPPHMEHWLYDWFVRKAAVRPDLFFLVRSTSYENPYLPKEYISSLEADYGPSWVKRYLLGEFGQLTSGTAVYGDDFNDRLHVREGLKYLADRVVYRAWDFGFHHPAVLWAQMGPNRVLRIYREFMGDRVLIHKFADEIIYRSSLWFPGARFSDVGDPAGGQRTDKDARTSIDILRERNIRVNTRRYPKTKLIEVVSQRLQMVRKGVDGEPEGLIQIDKQGCPVLIEGLRTGYAWPKAKDGRIIKETPLEDGWFEHLQDDLQYLAASLFLGAPFFDTSKIKEPSWNFG